MENSTARVVRVEKENSDISSVYMEGYAESFSKRFAGNFLTLKIKQEDGQWSKAHPFTISCAPEDPVLRATIKRLGEFTTRVHALKPGDELDCAGPYGLFCKGIDSIENIVLIAGGVGITPFLSVLRHFRNIKALNRVLLIWSNKGIEDAFALDELKAMTAELNLRIVHNLSREDAAGAAQYADPAVQSVMYEPGRCTREVMKKHISGSDPAIFLCGPPPMQDFILAEVESLGIDPKNVKKENFAWKGGK